MWEVYEMNGIMQKYRGIYIKWLPLRIVGNELWMCSKERVYELYEKVLEKQVL